MLLMVELGSRWIRIFFNRTADLGKIVENEAENYCNCQLELVVDRCFG